MLIDMTLFMLVLMMAGFLLAWKRGHRLIPERWLIMIVLITGMLFVPLAIHELMKPNRKSLFLVKPRDSYVVRYSLWFGEWFERISASRLKPAEQLELVRERARAIEDLLSQKIPAHRKLLITSQRKAQEQMQGCRCPEAREVLKQEIRSAAEERVALDRREEQCSSALLVLGSAERQLERCQHSADTLGPQTRQAMQETAKILQQTAALLEMGKAEAGKSPPSLNEHEIQEKLRELE